MKRYIVSILLMTLLPGWAAITTAPKRGEGNRFLFVVDTSSSMKRVQQEGRQVVYDLIYSGLGDRMQPGDTFGVWTFGDKVKAGVFPMQTWQPEKNADLATQVQRFIKDQSSGKKSYLDVAVTNAEQLIKSLREVDILFITSASTRFKLDDSWAVVDLGLKARVEEARKGDKAVILAIAGRNGQIGQATVTLEGEPLKLGPPPPRRTAPVARTAPAAPPKIAREPIIMRGSPNARPLEEIPNRFSPPPSAPVEPVANPAPEPTPVPVLGTPKPVVSTPPESTLEAERPGEPIPVAAREPGQPAQASPAEKAPSRRGRTWIIAGIMLVMILGVWILSHARSRARAGTNYVSRQMDASDSG